MNPPGKEVKLLPEPKGRMRSLSVEKAEKFLEMAHSHLRPVLVCVLETGMRREWVTQKWYKKEKGPRDDYRDPLYNIPDPIGKNGRGDWT
jgi:hypothetical protein